MIEGHVGKPSEANSAFSVKCETSASSSRLAQKVPVIQAKK